MASLKEDSTSEDQNVTPYFEVQWPQCIEHLHSPIGDSSPKIPHSLVFNPIPDSLGKPLIIIYPYKKIFHREKIYRSANMIFGSSQRVQFST